MASGGKGGRKAASDAAEGIIAKGAKEVLKDADPIGPQDAARAAGRAPTGRGVPSGTTPTGSPGGTPTGRRTPVREGGDPAVARSDRRENDAATNLADQGYKTHQNPTPQEVADARANTGDTGKPTSKPDYLIEGRVFDCYSPSETKGVRGIASEVEDKVQKEQTQRVVVNLQDWGGDLGALKQQFADWPIEGLKELKAVQRDGTIVQIPLTP